MIARINFTADEWKVLCDAPLAVGGAVAAAAPSGVVGTVKEGVAIINHMRSAAQRYPRNQLVQEVVPKGISSEQVDAWTKVARAVMQRSETPRLMDAGVMTCQKVAMILQSKADPQEADEFKRWLLEIGEDVANAAKEGGNVGTNISPQETQILSMMSSALGVTHIPSPSNPENYLYP